MSALQIGLIALGLALLLALLAHTCLTARRQRRGQRARIEPELEGSVLAPQAAPLDASAAELNSLDGPDSAATPEAQPAQQVLDARIDTLAVLASDHALSGDAILAALPASRRIDGKPFHVEAQHLASQHWELPRPGQRYQAVRAGVQRANRAGALNEIGFSQFIQRLDALADSLQLRPDYPDMLAEVAQARALDQFAHAHDAQLSLYLRSRRAAWSPDYISQHAQRAGLVAGSLPGRLVLPAATAGAAALLVLQFETQAALAEDPQQALLYQFTLTLDVPQVPRSARPYVRLRELAQALAQRMEGEVCDGAGVPLGADALDAIGAELDALYSALEAQGFEAGSALARRLFS